MSEAIYTDVNRRHDFVMLFDVTDGNPNGDPDAGNLPRVDPETMEGIVTDVCIKRKVRNYIQILKAGADGYGIYINERGVALNTLHREAYKKSGILIGESVSKEVPIDLVDIFIEDDEPVELPEGFSIEENDEGIWLLVYSNELDDDVFKEAIEQIRSDIGEPASRFAKTLKVKTKRKTSKKDVDKPRQEMCKAFFDVRMFGAVMSTGINCGQVRGPVQLTFSRSIDKVFPNTSTITRVAVTREEDKKKKETEMGNKHTIPYGLYKAHGFFTPHFAKDTGVSPEDLEIFWAALINMWDIDHSASRGMMAVRGLYVFTHENSLGNAPAHALFDKVTVERKDGVTAPRKFQDYAVNVGGDLPDGVTLTRLVG